MKRISVLAAALVLSACGGGGSDSTTATTTGTTPTVANAAEGFWNGTASTGEGIEIAVLENGETWGIATATNTNTLVGALYGNITTSGTAVSGTGTSYSFLTQLSSTGALTGTVANKSTLSLLSQGGTSYNGTYDSTYEQPALLSNLQGAYTGFAVGGATPAQNTTVVVDAAGNISSSFVSGSLVCNTTGKATPRASGKNIFDVQLTFTGNFCALGSGTTTTGVGTVNVITKQLIAMTLKADKSDGLMFVGTRP